MKIIGNTVGTPLGLDAIKDKLKPLTEENLVETVNDALAQAKASGEFDGRDGVDGQPGKDGASPAVAVSKSGKVTTVTITDASGTKTATINDGSDGQPGKDGSAGSPGKDGTSVTVTNVTQSTADGGNNVVTFSDGKTLTVKNGSKGSKGDKGDPYTLTEGDKASIVAAVIESLGGQPIFGVVDENNNIVVQGNLTDGTYSVKYEMANGTKLNIGNLVIDTNVYYTVTNTLTQCTTNNSATQAVQGGSYSATITAKSGYELKSIVVKMGGTDISSTAVSGGKITIANVTGNIVITATATEIVASYTNLAKNFETGRFNSSGAVDASTTAATACTDYIGPLKNGDIIRIKGFGAGTDYNSHWANASKGTNSCAKLANTSTMYSYSYDSATGIITLTKLNDNAGYTYYRISGKLTGTTADVIITLNEPIV